MVLISLASLSFYSLFVTWERVKIPPFPQMCPTFFSILFFLAICHLYYSSILPFLVLFFPIFLNVFIFASCNFSLPLYLLSRIWNSTLLPRTPPSILQCFSKSASDISAHLWMVTDPPINNCSFFFFCSSKTITAHDVLFPCKIDYCTADKV